MEFDCINKGKSKTERWKGRIKSLYKNGDLYEFWNREKLVQFLGKVDGITVASALKRIHVLNLIF